MILWLRRIYIPVWIDLKIQGLKNIFAINFNLHSSMDRFEEGINDTPAESEINLHSSMDRFEE